MSKVSCNEHALKLKVLQAEKQWLYCKIWNGTAEDPNLTKSGLVWDKKAKRFKLASRVRNGRKNAHFLGEFLGVPPQIRSGTRSRTRRRSSRKSRRSRG